MLTFERISIQHGVELPPHLELQALIPVSTGPEPQGDLMVIPIQRPGAAEGKPVPPEGIPVVRGENGGNTHLLTGVGVTWRWIEGRTQDLGVFRVSEGAVGYLLHSEHGAQGFAPGEYLVRRQREQADQIRLVTD